METLGDNHSLQDLEAMSILVSFANIVKDFFPVIREGLSDKIVASFEFETGCVGATGKLSVRSVSDWQFHQQQHGNRNGLGLTIPTEVRPRHGIAQRQN